MRQVLIYFYYWRGMTHRHLGHLYGGRREYRRAVADFTRALRIDPHLVSGLYDRAIVLWRELGDGAGAERDLSRVIELDSERSEAWFSRAFARQAQGDTSGAISDLEHYLTIGTDKMWREISRQQIDELRGLIRTEERSPDG